MNPGPILRPQLSPPVLSPYSGLSADAQRVMAVIMGEYERKKEVLKRQQKTTSIDSQNYYNSVYRGSFNADVPTFPPYNTLTQEAAAAQQIVPFPVRISASHTDPVLSQSLFSDSGSQQPLDTTKNLQHFTVGLTSSPVTDNISISPETNRCIVESHVKAKMVVPKKYPIISELSGTPKHLPVNDDFRPITKDTLLTRNPDMQLSIENPSKMTPGKDNLFAKPFALHTSKNIHSDVTKFNSEVSTVPSEDTLSVDLFTDEDNGEIINFNISLSQESADFSFDSSTSCSLEASLDMLTVNKVDSRPGSPKLLRPDVNIMVPEEETLHLITAESGYRGLKALKEGLPLELSPLSHPQTLDVEQETGNSVAERGTEPLKRKASKDDQKFGKKRKTEYSTTEALGLSTDFRIKGPLSRHSSLEDADLDAIESMLSQETSCSQKSGKSGKKFKAPFKPPGPVITKLPNTNLQQVSANVNPNGSNSAFCFKTMLAQEKFCFDDEKSLKKFNIFNIKMSSPQERFSLKDKVLVSKEVLLALVYKDGSSSISSEEYSKKKNVDENSKKVIGLILTAQNTEDHLEENQTKTKGQSPLLCVYIPLLKITDDKEVFNWTYDFLESFMSSPVRKVTFQAKDLILKMVDVFNFPASVTLYWVVLDVQIASWLLDPDNPVLTFDAFDTRKGKTNKENTSDSIFRGLLNGFGLLASTMREFFHKLKSRDLWMLFIHLETRLIPLLAKMERTKITVDSKLFLQFSDTLKAKLGRLEKKAHQLAGHAFCINSHPQLRQVLFEELCLDKKTKTKVAMTAVNHAKSTSESVLTQLVDTHPLPAIILEYRQLQKLKSTYVDGLMVCVDKGSLFTHWDQIAAATGRLTSNQPNLQSVPKQPVTITDYKTSYIIGKDVSGDSFDIFARDPIVSQDGWSLLSADFQQIELRLLAHLSDDPDLISVFTSPNTVDIFIKLTSQWLGKPTSDVSQQEREQTKRVVYSVMYGAGKEKLAEYLKIDVSHAKAIMTSFLDKFPAINTFTKKCKDFCIGHGYTCTVFKRRRLIPNINHKSQKLRAQAERQAVNFCVQGSAADLCKAAMLQVEESLHSKQHIKARLLLQIHDELLYEVVDENLQEFTELVKSVMQSREKLCGELVNLQVPLSVSISVGKQWGHLQEES